MSTTTTPSHAVFYAETEGAVPFVVVPAPATPEGHHRLAALGIDAGETCQGACSRPLYRADAVAVALDVFGSGLHEALCLTDLVLGDVDAVTPWHVAEVPADARHAR